MSTQEEQDEQAEIQKKQLAHYSAAVAAWFNTQLEHDKSLLTLSTAGIGLLVSVVAKAVGDAKPDQIIYKIALAAFIACAVTVLWIYKRNSKHLEDVIHNQATDDAILGILDVIAICAFTAGIVFSSWLGIRIANHSPESKEAPMSTKDSGSKRGHLTGDSFNKAISTRPGSPVIDPLTKSFNGAAKIGPIASSPKPAATTPANAPAPPANTQTKKS